MQAGLESDVRRSVVERSGHPVVWAQMSASSHKTCMSHDLGCRQQRHEEQFMVACVQEFHYSDGIKCQVGFLLSLLMSSHGWLFFT